MPAVLSGCVIWVHMGTVTAGQRTKFHGGSWPGALAIHSLLYNQSAEMSTPPQTRTLAAAATVGFAVGVLPTIIAKLSKVLSRKPTVKLVYFNVDGLGEPIRLALYLPSLFG